MTTTPTVEQLVEEVEELEGELREALGDSYSGNALYGPDWVDNLSNDHVGSHRGDLEPITRLSRTMTVANPLIRRGVSLRCAYVWGGGVDIIARASGGDDGMQDVNSVVQAFLDTPGNALVADLVDPVNERSLATDGQVFFVCFTNPATGAVQVRRLPWDQVRDILTNPEDASEPWYYKREWDVRTISQTGMMTTEHRVAYYPALRYRPQTRPKQLSDGQSAPAPIHWDAPVHHMAVNRLDGWQFGLGDVFAGLDWARAYSVFLEDWAKLMKALSMLAWRAQAKGSKTTNMAAKILAAGQANTVGATAVTNGDITVEAIPKTGATIDADSGRPVAAMVAAALDVPVTMLLGDPGTTGARAVAETLDRPTELMATLRRGAWTATFHAILDYVIDQAIKAPAGPLQGTVRRDPYTGREMFVLDGDTERTIDIVWPDLEDVSVQVLVTAIAEADATGKLPPLVIARLLLQAMHVSDVDEVLADLVDEDGNWVDPQASAGQVATDAFRRGQDPVALVGDEPVEPVEPDEA